MNPLSTTNPKPPRSRSIMWKMGTIFILILLMLIPLTMINGVIQERNTQQEKVKKDIASSWADQQIVFGPILVLPYQTKIVGEKKKAATITYSKLYVLPNQYDITGNLAPQIRERGIYKSIVYTSDLNATGNFSLATLQSLHIPQTDIFWDKAFVIIGLSETKGLSQHPELTWNQKSVDLLPGTNDTSLMANGLYVPVSLKSEASSIPFRLKLNLKGSQTLSIIPAGKESHIHLTSSWRTPSFIGNFLPSHRTLNRQGFEANWDIPYFSRSYAQAFTADQIDAQMSSHTASPDNEINNTSNPFNALFSDTAVGVSLYLPIDLYRQTDRATKYGILFLGLTFATYFLFEMITRHKIHPFQYLLVGLSLCLFYLLLLSLSEVIGFNSAYTIAALTIIITLTLYSKNMIGRAKRYAHYIVAGLLSALYGYLYILLQLEDLSLLFGTIGLFIVLATMMYVTRNIDWYTEDLS